MTVDRGRQRPAHEIKDIIPLGQLLDLLDVLFRKFGRRYVVFTDLVDVVSDEDGAEHAGRRASRAVGQGAVYSHDLHAVSGFASVHQIVVHHHVHRARQQTSRGALWHFLDRYRLVILVYRHVKHIISVK